MEMQQVRYFLALARTLNFTRAAEQANVSQPALTRAIQQLEHELGGPLFHRERANTHLSELGRMMLPYLEQIQAQTEAAKQQARAAKKLENVALKIGVMCTIGPALIADLIVKFRMAHPNVELEVTEEGSTELMEMLSKGDLHLALFGLPEGPDVRFHGLPLFQERFVLAIPPDHPLAAKNVISCRDTHEQPYVSRANCEIFDVARRQLREAGVRWNKVFSSERDDWVQGMIKAGLGIGFFPELSVTDPGLVTRRLIDPEFVRTIMLVTVRGRPHSPAVGAFVQAARAFKWPTGTLDPVPAPAEDAGDELPVAG
ncbi:MAG: LysR family transcriptional regulator [Phenylobacterium sp.]|uniref:LysR family transcriptional regulator n=1 Tax=Phenylobacterium sp. TaxID=1871053 RepID=UPI001A62E4CE|nr:LysR family transcriptional regulator [Phenylobacterium sp.]MBL8770238.1 LysR family transcriptional regulator [Phenylobacterium sp.]